MTEPTTDHAAAGPADVPTPGEPRLGPAFRQAWPAFRRNVWPFLALLAGAVGTWVLLEVLVVGLEAAPLRPLHLVLHGAYFVGASLFEAAVLKLALALADGRELRIAESLRDLRGALHFTAVKLALVLVVLPGLALLLVPGVWLAGRLGFALFFAAEGRGAGEAFTRSFRLTAPFQGRLTAYAAVLFLLNLLGACLLGIGLVVTVPVTALIGARLCRDLMRFTKVSGPLGTGR